MKNLGRLVGLLVMVGLLYHVHIGGEYSDYIEVFYNLMYGVLLFFFTCGVLIFLYLDPELSEKGLSERFQRNVGDRWLSVVVMCALISVGLNTAAVLLFLTITMIESLAIMVNKKQNKSGE